MLIQEILKIEIQNLQNLQLTSEFDGWSIFTTHLLISFSSGQSVSPEMCEAIKKYYEAVLHAYSIVPRMQDSNIVKERIRFHKERMQAPYIAAMLHHLATTIRLLEDIDALEEEAIKSGKFIRIPKTAFAEVIVIG